MYFAHMYVGLVTVANLILGGSDGDAFLGAVKRCRVESDLNIRT